MCPYRNPEDKKEYDRLRYLRRKAELEGEEYPRGNQDHTNELLQNREEYEEHRSYREAFDPRRPHNIFDLLNPRPMRKGSSDSPQSYGEAGTLCCSVCGSSLRRDGSCPVCNPTLESQEVERQRKLELGYSG